MNQSITPAIQSVEDLDVYQKLCNLAIEIHEWFSERNIFRKKNWIILLNNIILVEKC